MSKKELKKIMSDWRDLPSDEFAEKYKMTISQVEEIKAEKLDGNRLQKRLTKIGAWKGGTGFYY